MRLADPLAGLESYSAHHSFIRSPMSDSEKNAAVKVLEASSYDSLFDPNVEVSSYDSMFDGNAVASSSAASAQSSDLSSLEAVSYTHLTLPTKRIV